MEELITLQEFGLSRAESAVYLALLELGSSLAGPIIKHTGLHRGTTYQVLQRLKEKGLVSSIVKGRKQYFEAVDPTRLLDIIKEQQDRISKILPSLQSRHLASKAKQDVTVYSGVKGIRSVLDTILEELSFGGEYVDFGVSGLFKKVMGPYWELWQKRKKEHNIKSKVIFSEELKQTDPHLLEKYIGKARFHPKEHVSITDTLVYLDTVVLFIWTGKPPLAIVIKNKENALSYRNQFTLMWKHAK